MGLLGSDLDQSFYNNRSWRIIYRIVKAVQLDEMLRSINLTINGNLRNFQQG